MDEKGGIEKRAINRKQIAFLIDVLQNEKKETHNYYNYNKAYQVRKIGDTVELFDRPNKNNKRKKNK